MENKFKLIIDSSAKTRKQITDELNRLMELKKRESQKKQAPAGPLPLTKAEKDLVMRAIKKAAQDKISTIVRNAIKQAQEDISGEKSYGEKIPPRPQRNNVDYAGSGQFTIEADELAYPPESADDDQDGVAIRVKIAEMRKLGNTFYNGYMLRRCAEETFVKQGEYMKDVTDDYPRRCFCGIERPIYGSMSTDQLRTYFTWRTQARRGVYPETDKPYVALYCMELLNKIGAASSADAYNKLCAVRDNCVGFCPSLEKDISRWLSDFRAFNNIPDSECCSSGSDLPQWQEDILQHRFSGKLEPLMDCSSYNLRGSIFYSEETKPLLDGALEAALTALDKRFSEKGVSMFGLLCGRLGKDHSWSPFRGAYVDLERMDGFHSLKISALEQYSLKRGQPCLEVYEPAPYRSFVGWVLKSVECVLRKRTGFRYSLTVNITPVLEDFANREKLSGIASAADFADIIPDTVGKWCDEHGIFPPKKEKKRRGYNYDELPEDASAPKKPLEIDVSKLAKIREESDITASKLIIEETDAPDSSQITEKTLDIERDSFEEQTAQYAEEYSEYKESAAEYAESNISAGSRFDGLADGWREFACQLSDDDIALLRALLSGGAEEYCRSRGVMPETEYDRINSAAMEYTGDVLIENGEVIPDYVTDAGDIIAAAERKNNGYQDDDDRRL